VVYLRRLATMVVIAAVGLITAAANDWRFQPDSTGYLLIATALLAIGLFSATYEVCRPDLSGNVGLVLNAVTFGVLFKAALAAGVMYAVFRVPEYLVLGVVVAQIDPLAVAVMRRGSRLSSQARAILSAWASFDDPVTAILAVYFSTIAVSLNWPDRAGGDPDNGDLMGTIGGYSNIWLDVLLNALLAVVAFGVWLGLRALARRQGGNPAKPATWPTWLRAVAVAALLIAGAVAVNWFLMLGIAIVGLFFRPGIDAALRWAAPAALAVAVFMLGLVLAGGVNVVPGVVLGVSAFLAQVIVGGLIVTRSLPSRRDRWRLALSQQNGITAIILALVLEAAFPGFVAIIGPAILVIGVLYLVSNAVLDRVEDARASTREEADDRSTDVDGKGLEFRPESP
jgi:NhaP-type Na+/H+ or K+/H+ antiporter